MYRVLRITFNEHGEFLGTVRTLSEANKLADHDMDVLINDYGVDAETVFSYYQWEIFRI